MKVDMEAVVEVVTVIVMEVDVVVVLVEVDEVVLMIEEVMVTGGSEGDLLVEDSATEDVEVAEVDIVDHVMIMEEMVDFSEITFVFHYL